MKVKTRFAPSPTGNLHIGSIRTALYSWLFARHNNGEFILRIEDTDVERSQEFSVSSILEGLKWLGLNWDEGPYFQSKRIDRYKNVIDTLLSQGSAYKCFCSKKKLEEEKIQQILKGEKARYSGTCRNLTEKYACNKNYIVRFKNPLIGKVVFHDKIRGKISIENKELDDLVIQRSNGIPTYNLCVVIDDLDMKITHVIRGEDHINNTPRQINILKSLGAEIPIYAHVSMICDQNGQKISKRQEAINIIEYRKDGIIPEALLNYVIRLGWSYGDQEIFNINEMQELFSLESVSKSSSIISPKKLLWLNKYYMNNLSVSYISYLLKEHMHNEKINLTNGPRLEHLVELFKKRHYTLKEIAKSCRYFYEEFSVFNPQAARTYLILSNLYVLEELYQKMFDMVMWEKKNISSVVDNIVIKYSLLMQEVNMILRVSLTGNMHSPSITAVIFLMGKEKTLLRIQNSINYIKNINCQHRD